jgi:hypothetical protein
LNVLHAEKARRRDIKNKSASAARLEKQLTCDEIREQALRELLVEEEETAKKLGKAKKKGGSKAN